MLHAISTKGRGFTLVEICIIIVILGLFLSAALQAYSTYLKARQVAITKENIYDARRQIEAFRAKYGYYPCPADAADSSGQATDCTDATENNPPSLISSAIATPLVPGHRIRIGAMPVTAVIDPDGPLLPQPLQTVRIVAGERSVDGWRNRLAYAVIEQMAVPPTGAGPGDDGSITVQNVAGPPLPPGTGNRKYVIFSHGEDGAGAYTLAGVRRSPCAAGALDSENCNGDDVFVDLAPNEVRSTTRDANNYDDFVESDVMQNTCGPSQIVIDIASDGSPVCSANIACPNGMYFAGMNATTNPPQPICLSHSCPGGSFFTGVDPATGDPLCTANCPPNTYFAGTLAGGAPDCRPPPPAFAGVNCGGRDYLRGIRADGTPDCQPAVEVLTGVACPPGQALRGFDGNGNPVCIPSAVAARDMGWWFDNNTRIPSGADWYRNEINQSDNPDPNNRLYVCGVALRANCDMRSSEDACISVRYCSFDP